jgi:hypothetical protein
MAVFGCETDTAEFTPLWGCSRPCEAAQCREDGLVLVGCFQFSPREKTCTMSGMGRQSARV